MLAIYLRDRVRTMSASKLRPTTDNFILPIELLRVTPQAGACLHGREGDVDRCRVPVHALAEADIGYINRYRAECRAPVNATEEMTEVAKHELGPPGGRSPAFPSFFPP